MGAPSRHLRICYKQERRHRGVTGERRGILCSFSFPKIFIDDENGLIQKDTCMTCERREKEWNPGWN